MSKFKIKFTKEADEYFLSLKKDKGRLRIFKAVSKTLYLMSEDIRHPSLATHEFHSKKGRKGEKIFESYAQNKTPGAYRIFWHYGPEKHEITVVLISPHP